ncbi:PIN domain-containing protein [Knoellia koreensis]|uniref:Ribonuclease VapC n=1 Tax=Knoellia koreensis TaxID=2730921 RepID=A0A849HH31_9MICO|nr:type II toxin-antitoxin system VapC family toxin [Knoellia sp. DB2414S]
MILVDTSVWIDHLHRSDPALTELLDGDEIGVHPVVVEELALGNIRQRREFLTLLGNLRSFPVLRHDELLALVDRHRLWGGGLSAADAHVMGSVLLAPGARLWTRDKQLANACRSVGVALFTG